MSDATPPPAAEEPSFDVPSIEEMAAYLPQLRFEKLAACGGMGAVYKAHQDSLDRRVAVKILPPKFSAEAGFAERFKSEARAMAKLSHTNIVGVYDFGVTPGGHLYLIMEWIEGRSLHDAIYRTTLPPRKAMNLALQLCDALSFAHMHGIIHRDIKPGNIMINAEDHVKVADFGLARPADLAEDDTPMGTPGYAAPEITGGSVTDHRVDIYAAGVVLYEMLAGRMPETPRRPVTLFTKVTPRWDEVIAKATDPDPARRYQDAIEFRAHINVAIKMEAGIALPDVLVDKPKTAPSKKAPAQALSPQVQMILTVVLVGLVVAGLVTMLLWPSAKDRARSAGATPDEVRTMLKELGQQDAELAQLLQTFTNEWSAAAPGTSAKLHDTQVATLEAKAAERAAAARRAEILAAELAHLKAAPTIQALQENAGK